MTSTQSQHSATSKDSFPLWESWKSDETEFKRESEKPIVFQDDKIVIIGGYREKQKSGALNFILVDPQTQKVQVIPTNGDPKIFSVAYLTGCYWRDSKIVILAEGYVNHNKRATAVRIVTLKDLDSQTPTAHWEQTKEIPDIEQNGRIAWVYKDKFYTFGRIIGSKDENTHILCLDLNTLSWTPCKFNGAPAEEEIFFRYAVFHENKIYIVDGPSLEVLFIREFDLETMTYRTIDGGNRSSSQNFHVCDRLIDGKIYILSTTKSSRRVDRPFELWTFDLESEQYKQETTINPPNSTNYFSSLYCNNQLILYISHEGDYVTRVYGKFLSLSLGPPKTQSKTQTELTPIQRTIKQFLAEGPYSDICFQVESEIIPAHKWWLTQRSKYFANMFSSGMLEAQVPKIVITDMTATAFKALLQFLYTDYVELNEILALELLREADKYSVSELKKICEEFLAENLTSKNYVVIGQMAELVEGVALREAVVNYIAKYMKKLKQQKDFQEISDGLLRDSIVKFIVK